jgi:phage-related protein
MEIYFFNKRTQRFFEGLDKGIRAQTQKNLDLLRRFGPSLGMPHSRPLGKGLFELRIIDSVHVRFCYAYKEDGIWLLHGFVKKTRIIPRQDLEYARKELASLLRHYNE